MGAPSGGAGGLSISLRDSRKEFYLRNGGTDLPPYTGKVLKEKADSWHHSVSPSSHQARLDSLLTVLKRLADAGLGAASVLANLHHRRIAPLMERELRIHEMSEAANPTSLACSRFLHERLPREYAAMRARCAINLKAGRTATTTSGRSLCSPMARR
jgi:hypothetical protein